MGTSPHGIRLGVSVRVAGRHPTVANNARRGKWLFANMLSPHHTDDLNIMQALEAGP